MGERCRLGRTRWPSSRRSHDYYYKRVSNACPTTDFSFAGINAVEINYRIAHSDAEEEIETG